MKDKFTMELVWHNCKMCPPKEQLNPLLIATNGNGVHDTFWHYKDGYKIYYGYGSEPINPNDLENWYWADLNQTVQASKIFAEVLVKQND